MSLSIPVILTGQEQIPVRVNASDAGADLRSNIDIVIGAGGRARVTTGVTAAIPHGYAMFIHPRSGLALKHGITVLNAPGTIDADYRGDIGVILFNTSDRDFVVRSGDRIAQAVVQRVELVTFEAVAALTETERGTGGFGSTGA